MTRRHYTWAIITAVVITLALLRVPEVQIAVEGGRMRMEPAYIRLRVTVEPHQDNRGLWVGLVDGDYVAASSYEGLEGGRSPRTRWREFKDMGAGNYDAFVVLERVDGSRIEARDRVTVLSRY